MHLVRYMQNQIEKHHKKLFVCKHHTKCLLREHSVHARTTCWWHMRAQRSFYISVNATHYLPDKHEEQGQKCRESDKSGDIIHRKAETSKHFSVSEETGQVGSVKEMLQGSARIHG